MTDFFNTISNVPSWFGIAVFVPALLFCLRHEKKRAFWLRFVPSTAVYVALPYVVPDFYVGDFLSVGWFSFSYLVLISLTAAIMAFCFKVRAINLVFYMSASYAMQNTAFNIYTIVFDVGRLVNPDFFLPRWARALIGLAAYAAVYVAGRFLLIGRIDTEFYNNRLRGRVAVISCITLLVVYVLDMWLRSRFLLNLGTDIYAVLLNIFLLFVQWVLFRESRREREREILSELLRQEGKQHKLGEQNINIINIKFHDLKHRIEAIKKGEADDADEIERALDVYDAFVKSGNDVLDIVLTQKSLICKEKGIYFRVIADGNVLSFMSETDISALFGNILNNAIEAVENLDRDKRNISLNISGSKGFVIIRQDNCCLNVPQFRNGMPVSGNGDSYFHGYGTKSIKMIAEKYGGTVAMSCENSIFTLKIIIPVPADDSGSGRGESAFH